MLKPFNFSPLTETFIVSNPQKNGDTDYYEIVGMSPFTSEQVLIKRRYREFSILHTAWVDRLPGVYIP
jgi:hypothetical protein